MPPALRALVHRRWSSLGIVATLALGIGVTTAVFAIFNYAVFRPIPGIGDETHLVSVFVRPEDGSSFSSMATQAHLEAMRSLSVVDGLASYRGADYPFDAGVGGGVTYQRVASVTAGFFEILGAEGRAGRLFSPDEYERVGSDAAVVSERFWQTTLAGDPNVLSRRLTIRGHQFQIVGVVRAFRGLNRVQPDDVWVPFGARFIIDPSIPATRFGHEQMIGRLRPGVPLELARDRLREAFQAIGPVTSRNPIAGGTITYTAVVFGGLTDGNGIFSNNLFGVFRIAAAGVGVLFLLACANAANLLLSRNAGRRREFAVKTALGAGRARVFGELIGEAAILATAAGGAGLLVATTILRLLSSDRLLTSLPRLEEVSLDWRVAAYALVASALTLVLAALLPSALAARSRHIFTASTRISRTGGRLRSGLVMAQIALSMALLMSAGVLGRTFYALEHANLNFDADQLYTMYVQPRAIGYDDARTTQLFHDLEARLAEAPGVAGAGYSFFGQMDRSVAHAYAAPTDAAGTSPRQVTLRRVSEGYLRTLHVPMLLGRTFSPDEAARSPQAKVCVIDEQLSQSLFGNVSPIGRRLDVTEGVGPLSFEIVGVVAAIGSASFRDGFESTVYVPAGSRLRLATFHVRSSLPAKDAAALMRAAVHDVEPALPVEEITSVRDDLGHVISEERTLARIGWIVSVLAWLIAGAGIYAVTATAVSERLHEFGIRVALGATRAALRGLVFRRIASALVIGGSAGAILYVWGSRLIVARLYSVTAFDALTISAVALLILTSALLAAWGPARRAASADPMVALRAE